MATWACPPHPNARARVQAPCRWRRTTGSIISYRHSQPASISFQIRSLDYGGTEAGGLGLTHDREKHILPEGKKVMDILSAPVWSDTCPLKVSWKRSFESYIHGFHLNYAAIYYYYSCPRFCLMKISVIESSTVFHNCKNDDHQRKDSSNQSRGDFYFASTPPHLPAKLFGSVAKSSCLIR